MWKPSTLLVAVVVLLSGCAATGSSPAGASGDTVATVAGEVSSTGDGDVRAFLGIPYAVPPVGPLRWRPPRAVTPWDGVREATDYGPSCLQGAPKPFGPYTPEFLAEAPFSEDCLYLNVWAPKNRSADHPVLVWFHGGAFNSGSGAVPIYDGEAMAGKGAVVITVNYRLGVFGFLAHPDLTRESTERVSGNYGLLDMVEALKWVRANVSQFGGDPNKVTIAGQSAGAAAVNGLMISPLASGLFDRAIAQSGSGMGIPVPDLAMAERDGLELAARSGANGAEALRAVPGEELLTLTTEPIDLTADTQMPQYVPVKDGHVLPANADDPTATVASDVPLLTGFTADEVLPSGEAITASDFEANVRKRYGTSAEAILNLYPHGDDATAAESQIVLARDRYMTSLLLWASARRSATTQPIFLYLFDHPYPIPGAPKYKSFHTSDVPYALGNLSGPGRTFTDVDRRLSDLMQAAWLSFMTSGDPARGSGLAWQAYRPGDEEVMRLSEKPGPHAGVSSAARLQALREFVRNGGQLSLF